jgi:hypothetical protein
MVPNVTDISCHICYAGSFLTHVDTLVSRQPARQPNPHKADSISVVAWIPGVCAFLHVCYDTV